MREVQRASEDETNALKVHLRFGEGGEGCETSARNLYAFCLYSDAIVLTQLFSETIHRHSTLFTERAEGRTVQGHRPTARSRPSGQRCVPRDANCSLLLTWEHKSTGCLTPAIARMS